MPSIACHDARTIDAHGARQPPHALLILPIVAHHPDGALLQVKLQGL